MANVHARICRFRYVTEVLKERRRRHERKPPDQFGYARTGSFELESQTSSLTGFKSHRHTPQTSTVAERGLRGSARRRPKNKCSGPIDLALRLDASSRAKKIVLRAPSVYFSNIRHLTNLSRIAADRCISLQLKAPLSFKTALPQKLASHLDRVSTGSGSDLVEPWESKSLGDIAC